MPPKAKRGAAVKGQEKVRERLSRSWFFQAQRQFVTVPPACAPQSASDISTAPYCNVM
jgi:hypothetical protein